MVFVLNMPGWKMYNHKHKKKKKMRKTSCGCYVWMFHVQILQREIRHVEVLCPDFITVLYMKLHLKKWICSTKPTMFCISYAIFYIFYLTNKVVHTDTSTVVVNQNLGFFITQKVLQSILTPSNQMARKIPRGGTHQCSTRATHRPTYEGTFLWTTGQRVSGWGWASRHGVSMTR
jgi:hypothetical protein